MSGGPPKKAWACKGTQLSLPTEPSLGSRPVGHVCGHSTSSKALQQLAVPTVGLWALASSSQPPAALPASPSCGAGPAHPQAQPQTALLAPRCLRSHAVDSAFNRELGRHIMEMRVLFA